MNAQNPVHNHHTPDTPQVMSHTLTIDESIEDDRWLPYLPLSPIQELTKQVFSLLRWERPSYISLTFTSDDQIKELNKEFRDKNHPTNVLSFPGFDEQLLSILPFEEPVPLGDIVFSLETIEKEAIEAKKLFSHHLSHLYVHGLLHLFGYDHMEEAEAEEMESLEIQILQHFNIQNPYEA